MYDSMIESLRAWLESVRAWMLTRPEFGWLHEWVATTHVSSFLVIVVLIVVALILAIGFWPPLKPLPQEEPKPRPEQGEPVSSGDHGQRGP
jgi:hypothetical protein